MTKNKEYDEWCIEHQIFKRNKKNHSIYIASIAAVFITLILLPLIKVTISVQSMGVVRPTAEKVELKAPVSELIKRIYISEGSYVQLGDTLLAFSTETVDAQLSNVESLERDYESRIVDLIQFMCNLSSPQRLKNPVIIQEQQLFLRRREEITQRIQNAQKKWQRNKQLYDANVIAEDEFEQYALELTKAQTELSILIQDQKTSIKETLNELQNKASENQANLRRLRKERALYFLRSPVKGNIVEFSGIYEGSLLFANQTIASISPDSSLLVESYVTPKDIGFLYVGMPLKVLVESFNYNQWGMLSGKISEISSDFLRSENTAYYKVKCRLSSNHLSLKTGQKAFLKKGMTVQTRFVVARKSLLQILYQKFDRWVNPANLTNQNKTV